ncbi:MAG: metal-dependent hydrolase [Oscillochloris sp.]|nr:metal-dependent hydrolase [Oscillochloris sp.]
MNAEIDTLIAALRRLPDQLAELTAELSTQQLTTVFIPGEWTVAQNVHHVVDSHLNSYIRCKLIITEDRPTLRPYDQDLWAAVPDSGEADINISLALLRSLHERWARFWESLPADAWQRVGLHPESGELTLAMILPMYVAHGEAHLDQIRRTLAAA